MIGYHQCCTVKHWLPPVLAFIGCRELDAVEQIPFDSLQKQSISAKSKHYVQRIHIACYVTHLPSEQSCKYFIVIDFEATCWCRERGEKQWPNEISKLSCSLLTCSSLNFICTVEFPAVVMDTSTCDVVAEFHFYVQPTEHPTLSEFCTELTGIMQVVLCL